MYRHPSCHTPVAPRKFNEATSQVEALSFFGADGGAAFSLSMQVLGGSFFNFGFSPLVPGIQASMQNKARAIYAISAALEEAINRLFCPLQEKFDAFVLRRLRNISEAPLSPPANLYLAYFSPPEPRSRSSWSPTSSWPCPRLRRR